MERLLALLGNAVQFGYTCWDRIVVTGYIERLQRPENLVYFFHDLVGVACIEPAVLEQRTTAYRRWVRRVNDEHAIPVLAAPSGVRKEKLRALLPTLERRAGRGLRADEHGAEPHLHVLHAASDATQWGWQLPPHQGVSKTFPALLLVRPGP